MSKKRNWLDIAEYASLVGLGVGSVASYVSAQLLYTSAPLSLLVLLNLANRRRLEQEANRQTAIAFGEIDQRLSKNVELLNQHISELPSVETLGGLKKSLLTRYQEDSKKLSDDIERLQKNMQERILPLEKLAQGTLPQDVKQLQLQYTYLCETFTQINHQLGQLSNSSRVDGLERAIAQLKSETNQVRANLQNLTDQTRPSLTSLHDQINHLNRQFQKLPPPFDSTALKREVEELIRVVADLVPKRDWSTLVNEIKGLHRQVESQAQAEEALRSKLQELSQQMQNRPAQTSLSSLQNQINHLNRQFSRLPAPFDPNPLKQELSELVSLVQQSVPTRDWRQLVNQLKQLQHQQESQVHVAATLRKELQTVHRWLKALSDQSNLEQQLSNGRAVVEASAAQQEAFQSRVEAVLRREFSHINEHLRSLPTGPDYWSHAEATLSRELHDVNQQLQAFPSGPEYELLFDLKLQDQRQAGNTIPFRNREVLETAIDNTQQRLILIWPWSGECQLDDDLTAKFAGLLSRGCQLDIGWCQVVDPNEPRFLRGIYQRWGEQSLQSQTLDTLHRFLQLKRAYADRFQFKILGTPENFLVADQTVAIFGIDETLTTSTVLTDLNLKLRTTDSQVVQQLIGRFEQPALDATDVVTYWNRAVTRFELGDKGGAIADLDHLLGVNAQDAAAYNLRGIIYHDAGEKQKAVEDFSRALQINHQQVAAYCNRAFVYSELGDQLAAIADYSLAIQTEANSTLAYFFRGIACQKFGDFQGALMDYTETIRLTPDSGFAYYYRGLTHERIEDFRSAIADFEMAAKLLMQRGNQANAQKAMTHLNKLRQSLPPVDTSLNGFPFPLPISDEQEDVTQVLTPKDLSGPMVPPDHQPPRASLTPRFVSATSTTQTPTSAKKLSTPLAVSPPQVDNVATNGHQSVTANNGHSNGKMASIHPVATAVGQTPSDLANQGLKPAPVIEPPDAGWENLASFFQDEAAAITSNAVNHAYPIIPPTAVPSPQVLDEAALRLDGVGSETLSDFCQRF